MHLSDAGLEVGRYEVTALPLSARNHSVTSFLRNTIHCYATRPRCIAMHVNALLLYFQLRMHQKSFVGRATPRPIRELTALPRFPGWIWRYGTGDIKGRKEKRKKGEAGKREEERGESWDKVPPFHP